MLPLKLLRSLVFGPITPNGVSLHYSQQNLHSDADDETDADGGDRESQKPARKSRHRGKSLKNNRSPLLLFVPTMELVSDAYRLAGICRDMGFDLYPTPSLSHIVFSFPASPSPETPSPFSFSSSHRPSSSSTSSPSLSPSLSWSLPNDAVLISFPSISSSSLSHLRSFVSLSKGFFKLVFISTEEPLNEIQSGYQEISNWNCCSFSLFSRVTNERIASMEEFSRALAGNGWTLYKSKINPNPDSAGNSVYLYQKLYSGRVRGSNGNGEQRVRELRLPLLDFRNSPLRILQYLVLMTDDVFFLA